MAVTPVAAASNGLTGASSVTVSVPTGTADGDTMLLGVSTRGDRTVTAPAGWTSLGTATSGSTGSDSQLIVYWRTASGEPASYTISTSANSVISVGIATYRGADVSTPIDVSGSSTSTLVAPSVTPAATTGYDVIFVSDRNNGAGSNSFTQPAGFTLEVNQSGATTVEAALGIADKSSYSSPTGTATWVKSLAGGTTCTYTVVLKVAAAASSGTAWPAQLRANAPVNLLIEMGFGYSPYAPVSSTHWTDITSSVRGTVEIHRGRSTELDQFQAGTVSLVLENSDRSFDPTYAAGPYYGLLLPNTKVRVSAIQAGTTYRLFVGFVNGWEQDYAEGDRDRTCIVTANDAFKILSRVQLPATPYDAVITNDGPSAWLTLGEITGTNAVDRSGNGRNGIYSGDITSKTTDALLLGGSKAMTFSGGDRVQWTLLNSLNFFGFAVECIFTIPSAQTSTIWRSNDTLGGSSAYFRLYIVGTALKFDVYNGAATNSVTSAVSLTANTVYHVIANVYSDGSIWTSIDLVVNNTTTTSATPIAGPNTSFMAGMLGSSDPYKSASSFSGTLTYVSVWNGDVNNFVSGNLTASQVPRHYQAAVGWVGLTTGDCFSRVLTLIGWHQYTSDTGASTVQAHDFGTAAALTYLQLLEQTEQGRLYVSADGTVTFKDRHSTFTTATSNTSQATFGDSGAELRYFQLVPSANDDTFLRNHLIVSRNGGSQQEYSDSTSITAYGEYVESITSLLNSDDNEMQDYAKWRVDHYKTPSVRFLSMELRPRNAVTSLWPQVLGREISDRVTVKRRPNNTTVISQDCLIEGISHTFTVEGDWSTTFYMSPVDTGNYFVLNDSVYGKLNTSKLAY